LGSPCDPAEIVAITFTEKAGEELCQRLRAAIAARAAETPGAAGRDWAERLGNIDRMPMGTIHGFAGRILRDHAVEAGLDPEFTILDEEAAQLARRQAARTAVMTAADGGDAEVLVLCAGH